MDKKMKVGVIFGGKSAENEVSLATGRYVFNLLDPSKYIGVALYMDKKGEVWEIPVKLVLQNTTQDLEKRLNADAKKVRFEELSKLVDFIFIALLGKYGEDGAIQGVFEMVGVPYSGSGILASAVGMHKRVHKDLLRSEGIDVAEDLVVSKHDFENNKAKVIKSIQKEFDSSVVVKPVMEGSSIGVSFVKSTISTSEVDNALMEAFKWDSEVLVEEFIKGQEFMCVVIGNDDPVAMQPSEAVFKGEIFDYQSKYMPGQAEYHTPIRASEDSINKIQELAVKIYKLVGIQGYGRVDGFLVDDQKVVISEPHTGTIMVPSSYVFQQAAIHKAVLKTKGGLKSETKLDPRTLITTIIDLGIDAHNHKKGTL